jgi:hypothetical protein
LLGHKPLNADSDDGRLRRAGHGHQGVKIGVQRHHNALLGASPFQDRRIVGLGETDISGVHHIVTILA